MSIIILSAVKRGGKTTFLRQSAARLAERGRSVGGIASPVVFENGQLVGYDLLDLRTDEQRPLARTGAVDDPALHTGAYRFEGVGVAAGNEAIQSAVRDGLDVIAIDEVGPLEFAGGGWTPGLEFALRKCVAAQELIVVVRPSMVDELPKRFPSPCWATARCIKPPWPESILL